MAKGMKVALGVAFLLAVSPVTAQPVGTPGPVDVPPDTDEGLQVAAGVSQVHVLPHQGDANVTVFGLTGGDPALNGEYIFLSFNGLPSEGSKIFRVGDVLEFHILSDSPGRMLLQVRENVMNSDTEVGEATRRVLVTWTPGRDGAPPATVRVREAPPAAPARARRR